MIPRRSHGSPFVYKSLVPLRKTDHDRRIADERDYEGRGERFLVPISVDEGPHVARRYPIAWREGVDAPEPCALRSLVPDQRAFRAEDETSLPLLVSAYPFAPVSATDGRTVALVDERTTVEGAHTEPVFAPSGEPSEAAARRLAALRRHGASLDKTRSWSRAFFELGLLEPWVVDLQLRGRPVKVSGLSILVRDELRRRRLRAVVDELGPEAYDFLVLHEISLFHMQTLAEAFVHGIATAAAEGMDARMR